MIIFLGFNTRTLFFRENCGESNKKRSKGWINYPIRNFPSASGNFTETTNADGSRHSRQRQRTLFEFGRYTMPTTASGRDRQTQTDRIEEFLFRNDSGIVRRGKDRFTNEVIFAFIKTSNMIQRKFIPGSQWLYFKIYTGVKTADEVLAHTIRPFLRELYAERWIDGSFFIRYNDPDFHIRLRLHIDRFENYALSSDVSKRCFSLWWKTGLL